MSDRPSTKYERPHAPRSDSVVNALSPAAAVLALAGSGLTFLGWFLDIHRLTDWNGDRIAMFVNTAVCSTLAAVGLLVLSLEGRSGRRAVTAIRMCAWGAMAISFLTLFEHLSGINLGLDTLLVRHPWTWVGATAPGRMGLPATVTHIMVGTGLLLATGRFGGRARGAAAAVALAAAFVPLTSLVAYWYGAKQLYGHPVFTGISFQTAWVLVFLAVGLLFAVREVGLAAMLRRPGDAGTLVRRLLPTLGASLLVIGWLRVVGEGRELYDSAFGTATFAVTLMVLLFATVLWTARAIEAQAESRARTEEALARRAAEQAALFGFTDRLQRAGDLPRVCEAGLDAIMGALSCDRASVLLLDDAGEMRFVGWRGLSDGYRRAVEGHSAWAPDDPDPRPVCVEDVERSELAPDLKRTVLAEGLGALGFIPLTTDGRLIGKFMVYYDRPHQFSRAS